MARYKLSIDPGAVIDQGNELDDVPITIFEDGPGWAEYQAWLAAGGVPDPAETFEEMQNRYFADLVTKGQAVARQGVDGPESVGDPTNTARAWATTDAAWGHLAKVLYRIQHVTDPALPNRFLFYTQKKKSDGSAPGDAAGLKTVSTGNDGVLDLQRVMYEHEDAVQANVEILWKAIDDATVEADLLAIDLDSGWPPAPSNP